MEKNSKKEIKNQDYEKYIKEIEILADKEPMPLTDKELNQLLETVENMEAYHEKEIIKNKNKIQKEENKNNSLNNTKLVYKINVENIFQTINIFAKELNIKIKKINKKEIKIEYKNKDIYNEKLKYYNLELVNNLGIKVDFIIEPIIVDLIGTNIEGNNINSKLINKYINKLKRKNNYQINKKNKDLFKETLLYSLNNTDLNNNSWKIIKESYIEDIEPETYQLYEIKTDKNFISNFFLVVDDNKFKLSKIKEIIENSNVEGKLKNFYLKIDILKLKKLKNILK